MGKGGQDHHILRNDDWYPQHIPVNTVISIIIEYFYTKDMFVSLY